MKPAHNPPPGVREIETTTIAGEYLLPPAPPAAAAELVADEPETSDAAPKKKGKVK